MATRPTGEATGRHFLSLAGMRRCECLWSACIRYSLLTRRFRIAFRPAFGLLSPGYLSPRPPTGKKRRSISSCNPVNPAWTRVPRPCSVCTHLCNWLSDSQLHPLCASRQSRRFTKEWASWYTTGNQLTAYSTLPSRKGVLRSSRGRRTSRTRVDSSSCNAPNLAWVFVLGVSSVGGDGLLSAPCRRIPGG